MLSGAADWATTEGCTVGWKIGKLQKAGLDVRGCEEKRREFDFWVAWGALSQTTVAAKKKGFQFFPLKNKIQRTCLYDIFV